MKPNTTGRRFWSILLCCLLLLNLLPSTALAETVGNQPVPEVFAQENDMHMHKAVTTNDNGGHNLTLEAYATGETKVSTSSQPMDIVLVLDVSGSMDEETTSYQYKAQNSRGYSYEDINKGKYYYRDDNGQYYAVEAGVEWFLFYPSGYYLYYKKGNQQIRISDTATSRKEKLYTGVLYTRTSTTSVTRMAAMQSTVNTFIESVASNGGKNHKIAVVKFSSGVETVRGLTAVDTSGKTALINAVNALSPSGATRTDYGMQHAASVLSGAGNNDTRQKIVILFTDGVPTKTNTFDNDVANAAISAAKGMKDSGVKIYTVGLINSPTDNMKKFLEYTSSNYPNATSMSKSGSSADTRYYKLASNGVELADVFQTITEETVNSGATADKNAVLTDTLTDYFQFAGGYTVYKVPCTGEDTWGTPVDITTSVTVTTNGKTISVTGFDYTAAENLVAQKEDGTWQGNKLVLTFAIQPDANAPWMYGTHLYDTNDTNELKAGVYTADDTAILALQNSPQIPMTAYRVTYSVTGAKPVTPSDLPADAIYLPGTTVSVAAGLTTTENTKDGKTGEWTFNGWDKTGPFVVQSDVAIKGTWNFQYTETMNITVTKVWNDGDNRDGLRPDSVTVQLLRDGSSTVGEPVTLTAANAATENPNVWHYTWQDVPKYDATSGAEISYTVTETSTNGNYTPTYGKDGRTITNTHEVQKVDITVNKVWDDGNNQDGVRPEAITVHLMNGDTVVDTATLDAEGGWTHTFVGLPKNQNGAEIPYTVEEEAVEHYTPTYPENPNGEGENDPGEGEANPGEGEANPGEGEANPGEGEANPGEGENTPSSGTLVFTITNTHTPATTNITVNKLWNDGNNQDGIRPETVTVQLMNGDTVAGTATLQADANGVWTHTFTNLPKYQNGVEISYTVKEENVAQGYTSTVEGFTITNTHTPATTEVFVTKVWNDENDRYGDRPESVQVQLMNGETVVDTATLQADANGVWTHTFTNLPQYQNGTEISYTVIEADVENYIPTYNPDKTGAITITNTYQRPADVTLKIPFVKVVKQGSTGVPGAQRFSLEIVQIYNSNSQEYADVQISGVVETNGPGEYQSNLVLTGPEKQLRALTCEGFVLREKNTGAAHWVYSDALYYISPAYAQDGSISAYTVCSATVGPDGEYQFGAATDSMVFENTYNFAAGGGSGQIEDHQESDNDPDPNHGDNSNPNTGDNGNWLPWLAVLFLSGLGCVGLVRRNNKNNTLH